MVKLIFSRIGKKKMPYYRIIALDKQKDPWGTFLEILGHYNPRTKETEIKADRIEYWMKHGAQPSATVHNLLVTQGVLKVDKKKVSSISKKKKEAAAKKAEKK